MLEAGQSAPAVLHADRLTKRYGERTVLHEVGLTLRSGHLTAIIGPNGAGKTTLLSILAGVIDADSGAVTRPATGVGWVPQQPSIYSKLSVRENLELFARLERVPEVNDAVERMLDQAGLQDRADERVGRLSGGNQQRVNIAVGLLSRPAALLLDEPTASLDPPQRRRLWEFVSRLADAGTAILFSTHNLREVELHAERVLVLDGGVLHFDGAPRELADSAARAAGQLGAPEFLAGLGELG